LFVIYSTNIIIIYLTGQFIWNYFEKLWYTCARYIKERAREGGFGHL